MAGESFIPPSLEALSLNRLGATTHGEGDAPEVAYLRDPAAEAGQVMESHRMAIYAA